MTSRLIAAVLGKKPSKALQVKLLGFRGCVPNSFNDKYLPSEPLAFPSPQARVKGPQEKTQRSWPRKTGVAFFGS